MKIRFEQFFKLLTGLAVTAPGIVLAADFTFTVPVEVNNLPPDSHAGGVDCALYKNLRPGTSPSPLGTGTSSFTITGGAYHGTVTVSVDANPGVNPEEITHYSCGLSFQAELRGNPNHQFSYWLSSAPSTLPVAPGAPYNPTATAPIH